MLWFWARLSPGKQRSRQCEVLLHISGFPTYQMATGSYWDTHIDAKGVQRGAGLDLSQARLRTLAQLLNCVAESLLSEGPFIFGGVHHRLAIVVANGQVSAMFNE